MARQLKIEIIEKSQTVDLGLLSAGEVPIGREPGPDGLVLGKEGVSRVHGSFLRIQNHWMYRDNSSTNGSWVNGKRLRVGGFAVVRHGTVLQLANVGLRVREVEGSGAQQSLKNFPGLAGRSIIVFSLGTFVSEFPVPEYGKALVVGGSGADLELNGYLSEEPALVFERRKDTVVCYSVSRQVPVYLNESEIDQTVSVSDGDEVALGEYHFLFNEPGEQNAAVVKDSSSNLSGVVRGWDDSEDFNVASKESQTGTTSNFGSMVFDAEEFSQDSESGGTFANVKATRTTAFEAPLGKSRVYESLEEKIILGIGLFVVIAVMSLLIWWLIQ